MAAPKQHQHRRAAPWYAGGLRFSCQRCGRCCTGDPGYVWVDRKAIHEIAQFLKMAPDDLESRFCRRVFWRISLLERPNGDCIFFTPAGCRIYPVRPAQCKSFPFWEQSLKSRADWEDLRTRCAGVGKGRLYTREEIEAIRDGKAAATRPAAPKIRRADEHRSRGDGYPR